MNVRVHVPPVLRSTLPDKARELSLSAANVREAFASIAGSHPDLYRGICDETGAIRRHVGVFVNQAHLRDLDGLDTRLSDGDVIIVLPAVSGG